MKKQFLLLFVLFAFSTVALNAQQRAALSAKFASPNPYANMEIQNIVKFDRSTGLGIVHLRSLKQGRNLLATDRNNGRKLMLLAERRGEKVRVAGFMIQERDGRYFKIPNPSSHQGRPDSFGCPDGWDSKIICYTHPTYDVKVCYTRCTPTTITLKMPQGL